MSEIRDLESWDETRGEFELLISRFTGDNDQRIETIAITKYLGNNVRITIPDYVDNISSRAFEGNESLVQLFIPPSVSSVGESAFRRCSSLEMVLFTDEPKPNKTHALTIWREAFYECKLLKELAFSEKADFISIDEEAFSGCESLTKVVLPVSTYSVGQNAFSACWNLETVQVEGENTTIEKDSFSFCPKLKNIIASEAWKQKYGDYIKESVEEVGKLQRESSRGCYIATSIYGSYDCPEVWTLRRYRDYVLAGTWPGRCFIKLYYAISPSIVRWFGTTTWFRKFWRLELDKMVNKLNSIGIRDTPYSDREDL